MELRRVYESAWREYTSTWRPVDFELYELCRRRGHKRPDDVYTKVAIINRVYAAGIARTLGANGERAVADALVSTGDGLRKSLRLISDGETLDPALAHEIVKAHGCVAEKLAARNGGKWLTSFVSKYLHFHRPSFPIFDGRAKRALRGFLLSAGIHVDPKVVVGPDRWDGSYLRFVRSFYALYRTIGEKAGSVPVTVKGVDHMLWRGGGRVVDS